MSEWIVLLLAGLPIAAFIGGVFFGRWTRGEALRAVQGLPVGLPKRDDVESETTS
ncbi:MAG: hypothetical protein WC485_04820 [Opitutaceae bacterium]